ncbi:MAG TPA: hypothetical protein VHH12_16715, partial [Mycobacterium sp.]|nr:hypothetical protein [Mycobacterium sp.]
MTVAAVAAALALLPHIPAQAALPKSKPTIKEPCPNNPKKTLRVWTSKAPFAVDNPCRDWFVILHKPLGQGDHAIETISVAGYSKVNLPIDMRTKSWRW